MERGENVICISGLNSTHIIDFLGQFGFDAVWIEAEHGPNDFADIPDLTRACDLWDMTSVVRVNRNNAGIIYRTFDVGAQGIVVPHVDTAEDARAVVDAAKFAPVGHRGMFGSRQGYGDPDYIYKANDETLVIVLIEDIKAVNNLDEILTVDNIDVFFVAPSDLAQSMGHLGGIDHPDVTATIDGRAPKDCRIWTHCGIACNRRQRGALSRLGREIHDDWLAGVGRIRRRRIQRKSGSGNELIAGPM